MKRRPSRVSRIDYSKLEPKWLLAGNIQVTLDAGTLMVFGDDAANEIEFVSDNNQLAVNGQNNTTINGTANQLNFSTASFDSIVISLNAGDDILVSTASLFARRDISINAGPGNDNVRLHNVVADQIGIAGDTGDDAFDIFNVATQNSILIDSGPGTDVLGLDQIVTIRSLEVVTGEGNDTVAFGSLNVGRNLKIDLSAGNDVGVSSGDLDIRKRTEIDLGTGNDSFLVGPAAPIQMIFRNQLSLDAGEGDDSILLGSDNFIVGDLFFDGGPGTDVLLPDNNSVPVQPPVIVRFEIFEGSEFQEILDKIFEDLESRGIDITRFGGEVNGENLDVILPETTVTFTEGGDPVQVAEGLTIQGDPDTVIKSGSVQLGGFVAGEDQLEFTNTETISGAFNENSGVLTLTGDGSISEYVAAFLSVDYVSESRFLTPGSRIVTVLVNDGQSGFFSTRELNVVAVNDPPRVTLSTNSRVINTEGLPRTIDPDLIISDPDHAQLSGATVTIVSGYVEGEDALTFVNRNGITGNFDVTTGALTLVGAADVGDYEDALKSVRFASSANVATTGNRTIRFSVDDGIDSSLDADIVFSIVNA